MWGVMSTKLRFGIYSRCDIYVTSMLYDVVHDDVEGGKRRAAKSYRFGCGSSTIAVLLSATPRVRTDGRKVD
jgi:hypothetical protein